jgi:hypothetical protein
MYGALGYDEGRMACGTGIGMNFLRKMKKDAVERLLTDVGMDGWSGNSV